MRGRFRRERRTIRAMIGIYCRDHHGRRGDLCAACADVFGYAELRLDKCLFPDNKPVCAACPVHCYKPAMREEVKRIMRYAGPRMIYVHPYLAIRHLLDGRKPVPAFRGKRGAAESPASPEAAGCCAAEPAASPSSTGARGGEASIDASRSAAREDSAGGTDGSSRPRNA